MEDAVTDLEDWYEPTPISVNYSFLIRGSFVSSFYEIRKQNQATFTKSNVTGLRVFRKHKVRAKEVWNPNWK